VVADGDPLIERGVSPDPALQLRLADQHQVENVPVVELKIQQQPDLFEGFLIDQLGFVDNQHRGFVIPNVFHHPVVEHLQQIRLGIGHGVQIELVEGLLEKVDRRQGRVRDQADVEFGVLQMPDEDAADHGLAAADLSRQHNDPLVPLDGVDQPGERLLVFRRIIHEFRVGHIFERVFLQTPIG